MDTLTSFLLNEDSALAFDSFNENVLQNLPHQAGQWDILDPLIPFADTSKYSAGSPYEQCWDSPAPGGNFIASPLMRASRSPFCRLAHTACQ